MGKEDTHRFGGCKGAACCSISGWSCVSAFKDGGRSSEGKESKRGDGIFIVD